MQSCRIAALCPNQYGDFCIHILCRITVLCVYLLWHWTSFGCLVILSCMAYYQALQSWLYFPTHTLFSEVLHSRSIGGASVHAAFATDEPIGLFSMGCHSLHSIRLFDGCAHCYLRYPVGGARLALRCAMPSHFSVGRSSMWIACLRSHIRSMHHNGDRSSPPNYGRRRRLCSCRRCGSCRGYASRLCGARLIGPPMYDGT